MAIRIGSNISSLQAQRELGATTSALSKVSERLSSGQRINRASDDAAGLAIASSLHAGRRVFSQGVRNLNDGISVLSIADSTIANLTDIVIRIRELTEQSANGTFSSKQREALDNEAQALSKEYFRVSREASFNGLRLFDGSLSQGLSLQGGFGASGTLQSSLGGVMGNATFAPATLCSTGSNPSSAAHGDLNGDGILDMVTADYGDNKASVFLGKGDGSFSARTSYTTGDNPNFITLGDLNGDGILDMIMADFRDHTASVFLGRGDGSFSQRVSFAVGANPASLALGDVNGDGKLDMAVANAGEGTVGVLYGRGDGTFAARISHAAPSGSYSVALGDLNRDGTLDMVATHQGVDKASVFLGLGGGTFSAGRSFSTGDGPGSITLEDLNGDGMLDMITADTNDGAATIFLGAGDGTFAARTSLTGVSSAPVLVGDLNGDGILDAATGNSYGDAVRVFLGIGDGTFSAGTSFAADGTLSWMTMADLNGDGVLDLTTSDWDGGTARILLGNTRQGAAPLLPFSLKTQTEARQAMAPLDRKLAQLSAQRGVIGAFQSRIGSAINTLQSRSDNYAAAEARIRDADIASESSALARLEIVQQAAAAVLAQANLQPSLALRLLQ